MIFKTNFVNGIKVKKLFDQAKKIIPSGVNSPVRFFKPYPFFVKKAQGSSIWDEDGRRYIDYCNGYGAMLLGTYKKGNYLRSFFTVEKGNIVYNSNLT